MTWKIRDQGNTTKDRATYWTFPRYQVVEHFSLPDGETEEVVAYCDHVQQAARLCHLLNLSEERTGGSMTVPEVEEYMRQVLEACSEPMSPSARMQPRPTTAVSTEDANKRLSPAPEDRT